MLILPEVVFEGSPGLPLFFVLHPCLKQSNWTPWGALFVFLRTSEMNFVGSGSRTNTRRHGLMCWVSFLTALAVKEGRSICLHPMRIGPSVFTVLRNKVFNELFHHSRSCWIEFLVECLKSNKCSNRPIPLSHIYRPGPWTLNKIK